MYDDSGYGALIMLAYIVCFVMAYRRGMHTAKCCIAHGVCSWGRVWGSNKGLLISINHALMLLSTCSNPNRGTVHIIIVHDVNAMKG